jgi:hypothetical protein
MAGYYPVVNGLAEGERIVSSPNFLIDSESRLQAVMEAAKSSADEHAGHGQ